MIRKILEIGIVNNNNLPQSECVICGFSEPGNDYLDIDLVDHPEDLKARAEDRMYAAREILRLCKRNGCAKLFTRAMEKALKNGLLDQAR